MTEVFFSTRKSISSNQSRMSSLCLQSGEGTRCGMTQSYRQTAGPNTKHLVWKLALDELRSPADATNIATRGKCIEYLEVQCVAALRKMHDLRLALRDKLSSQNEKNSYGNSQLAHSDLIGCHATNDALAESVFGTYDMILRRCPWYFYGSGLRSRSSYSINDALSR